MSSQDEHPQQTISKLESRISELAEALKTRDDFLSIAAHELKTPLAATKLKFQMGIKLLQNKGSKQMSEEAVVQLFKDGDRQISRLSKLIDNLLDLSRLDSDQLELQYDQTDLVDLIKESTDRFETQFKHAKCVLNFNLPGILVGEWDRDRLDQVVSNLFTNALRYASGSIVTVSLKDNGDNVTMIFEDTGPGIPIEKRAEVFSRYHRGNKNDRHAGLGLGLYITKEIISAHLGTIEIESAHPSGARFVIRLPKISGKKLHNSN